MVTSGMVADEYWYLSSGGEGVLSHITYIGMWGSKGRVFEPFWFEIVYCFKGLV